MGSFRKMDLQDNMHVIQERIVKTDEVIKLLDVKKKEASKLDKNYKKLIAKFCAKQAEVINLKNECQKLNSHLTNSPEIHLPCQKEIKELKIQNEFLDQTHNLYVNSSEIKYQSACQEIATLNKKCDSLNKKLVKKDCLDRKAKSVKKLHEELHEAKEQVKEGIIKFNDLETTSNKTISDLKEECKNLEERRNEALKQLAKARLDCDELRKSRETSKNSPIKSKLQEKIEELETELQSFQIERDILTQSHENDIALLKQQHEKETKLLEAQLKELQNKNIEETHIIKEKQDDKNDITELTNQHEIEKKLLKDQIAKLESKISKEVKNYEENNKLLKDQLEELKEKVSEETNKIKETTGTQTAYEDIYNLEDILSEMHSLPALMSPLFSENSVKQDTENDIPKTFSVAIGTDEVIPTLNDCATQTCESKIKVRTFNLRTEIFNNVDIPTETSNYCSATKTDDLIKLIDSFTQTNEDILPVAIVTKEICEPVNIIPSKTDARTFNLSRELSNKTNISVEKISSIEMETIDKITEDNDDIFVHLIPIKSLTCSTAVGSDDIIPTFTDNSSQTCDSVNENQSKIKVRSFDLCTEVFNKTLVETTDSSTQTSNSSDYHQNKIEFKSFEPSIITLPKNNILDQIPKNVKLKSRVTKKYKTNNKNRLLNTLRNSNLNLKCLLEKYINTNSKFVYVSASILKTDNNKTKIPENSEQKIEGCSHSYYSNCPHTIRHENYCSCSCQQNMFYNRYFGQCPVYQIPCNCNHDMYYGTNNSRNYYDMKQQFKSKHKNIDEIFSSSDSEEEDNDLRKVLKEYKNSVIKKYITNKYLEKIAKKNKNFTPDNFKNSLRNTNLFINNREKNKAKLAHKKKIRNKFPKSKQIIFSSSDSEEEIAEFLFNHKNKTNTISRSTKSNMNCSSNKLIEKSIPEEKEQNETVSHRMEINNSSNANFNNITNSDEDSDEIIQDFPESTNETSDAISRTPRKLINEDLKENMSGKSVENSRITKTISKIPQENNRSMETNIKLGIEQISKKRFQVNTTEDTTNVSRTFEENIHNKTVKNNKKHVSVTQTSKLPFILSKKQQLMLRKGKSLRKEGNIIQNTSSKVSPMKIYATRSKINCNPLKRKSSVSSEVEVEYKKQKQQLFGSDSDSDFTVDNCETSENAPDSIYSTDISNCSRINENEVFVQRSEQNETKTKNPEGSLISDNESVKEKISDITLDYTYSSNVQPRTRIALKNPRTCTTSMNVNLVSNTNISKSVLSNDCTSLSNDETIAPKTNKVFKRPGISKIDSTPVKKNRTQNECGIIRPDINNGSLKDSADSSDSSDAETNDFVTYNMLERPSTSIVKQGIEKFIDIGAAKKLIKDVATMDWNKELMATVVSYLADKNSATVARLIVNQAANDFSQEFDKSFTPPAPLLTTTQQKIMVLLSQLEKNNLPNIHTIFLQTVETRLLSETRVEVVHPLTRLYVASCKIKYEIERVRTLCCNAAYYMGDLLLPLMFIVLTMWGDILPMAGDSEDIPLAITIVHVIHSKTCKKPGYNFMNLNRLLSDYYGYKAEQSKEEIIKQLIRLYSDNYSKTAYTAIVTLCKNLPHKWTYNQIKNHLLPLLENCNNSDNKLMTISLIQRIISQFQIKADRDCIKNCLSKYVINPGIVPSI